MPSADALTWARRAFPGLDPSRARALPPAGSSRTLTRLYHTGGSLVLVENPVEITDAVNENDSFGYLAAHLGARGIPVPAVLAYKRSRGWMLVEDLGDRDLYNEVRQALHETEPPAREDSGETDRERIAVLYEEALAVLVRLQFDCIESFDPRRTHNPPRYDVVLMRTSESGYFVRELIGRCLGMKAPGGLNAELDRLAERASAAGSACLLHRDYQSQNLKIHLGRLCVIDFQGARLGPPQYDVAALLLDPYADLPADLRDRLLDHYLSLYSARAGEERGSFLEHWTLIAAHRLMQTLGAYAFLGLEREKRAFLAHIPAAMRLLDETLALHGDEAPLLATLVAEARLRLPSPAAGSQTPDSACRNAGR